VKNQAYLTSASLSPYALSSALSSYALTSTLSNYALTSTLSNYASTSTLSNYALSSSLSNYALSSSLSNYALLSGATFTGNLITTGNIKCSGLLDSNNASGTSGQIPTANGSGGWVWSSSTNTTTTKLRPLPAVNTHLLVTATGRYSTRTTTGLTNNTITKNGVNVVSIGLVGGSLSTTPIQFSNIHYTPDGTYNTNNTNIILIAPFYGGLVNATSNPLLVNANVYDSTGSPVRGYITLYQYYDLPGSYDIVFISYTTLNYNSTYTMDPFQFTYIN
jgi:hypothetical protein